MPALVRLLRGLPTIRLEGLYSHFASADDEDRDFTDEQMHRLYRLIEVIEQLEGDGWRPPIVHAANSAATLREPTSWLHMVRIGIALSGHYPSVHVPTRSASAGRRPAGAPAWRSRMSRPGTSIGYNRTFVAERPVAGRAGAGRVR